MTNAIPAGVIRQRFFDADGNPLAGGFLYSYLAGSAGAIKLDTYSSIYMNTTNTNPVQLDPNGYADVWLDPAFQYLFVLTDQDNVLQWSQDFIAGAPDADAASTKVLALLGANSGAGLVGTLAGDSLQSELNSIGVTLAAKADKTYVDTQDAAIQAQVTTNATNISALQSVTSTGGTLYYATWAALVAATGNYNAATAYTAGATVVDQGAMWTNILASTGTAPPTLPVTSNANWSLLRYPLTGQAFAVPLTDTGTHTDPTNGTTNTPNTGVFVWAIGTSGTGAKYLFPTDAALAKPFSDNASTQAGFAYHLANDSTDVPIAGYPDNTARGAKYWSNIAQNAVAGGSFGDIFTKTSDVSGQGFAWSDRQTLGQQPSAVTDLTVGTNYQILSTTFSNITTRYNVSVVSGNLRIASNVATVALVGPVTTSRVVPNKAYRISGFASAWVSAFSNAGIGIIFSAVAPTPGGAIAAMDPNTVIILLRGNGIPVASEPDGTVPAGVTLTGVSTTPYNLNDVATVQFVADSGSSGTVTIFLNNNSVQTFNVSGLPANAYVGAGMRAISVGDTIDFSGFGIYARSLDLTKRIYLDPSVGNTGANGTEAHPYTTLGDAVADYSIDSSRREIQMVLKGGVYRGSIVMPIGKWRSIRVASSKGTQPLIYPSEQITTGWTNIGGTNIWYRPHRWNSILNSVSQGGGIVDVSPGALQAWGRNGSYTVPWRLYQRLAPNTAITDPLIIQGTMWMTSTGYTGVGTGGSQNVPGGSVLIRTWNDMDPNTLVLERAIFNAGINIVYGSDADWNDCRVSIEGIETRYGYVKGINVERANVEILNCVTRATSVGYGFQMNQCDGIVDGCFSEGCTGDGLNMAGGGFDNGTSPTYLGPPPKLTIRNSRFYGFANLPNIVGDGISNHAGQYLEVISCSVKAAGKDGIAAVDSFNAVDFEADDCWDTGVQLLSASGANGLRGYISGGKISRCNRGIALDIGNSTGVTASIDVHNTVLDSNNTVSVQTFTGSVPAQPIVVNLYDVKVTGTTPINGHIKQNGGTVNVISTAPIA